MIDVENYYRKNLPQNSEKLRQILEDRSKFLSRKLNDINGSLEKLKEALEILEKYYDDTEDDDFFYLNGKSRLMNKIAINYQILKNYSEAVVWYERIWDFYQKHVVDVFKQQALLKDLYLIYCHSLKNYDKAAQYLELKLKLTEKTRGKFSESAINEREILET